MLRMKKTLLMMSLLGAAPLFAQAPVAEVAAAVQAVAAPSAADRAAACGAMAALPATADSFLILTDVGKHIADLAGDAVTDNPQAAMLLNIDSIALAASDAAVADLQKWAPLIGKLSSLRQASQLAEIWGEGTENDVPAEQASALTASALQEALAAVKDLRLAPVQLAAAFKGEGADMMPVMLKGLVPMSLMSLPGVEPVAADGSAVTDMAQTEGFALPLGPVVHEEGVPAEVREALKDKKIYLFLTVKGNALVATLTTEPALVQLPDSVENSLASTAAAAAFDGRLGKGLMVASSASAAAQKAENDINLASCRTLMQYVQSVFGALAKQDAAAAATLESAAAAVGTVMQQVEALSAPGVHPATMQVWRDKDVHVAYEADSKGCTFRSVKGADSLAPVAVAPQTMLYVSATGVDSTRKADNAAMCESVGKILNGVLVGLSGEYRLQAESVLAQVSPFAPVMEKASAAIGSMVGGMGSCGTLILTEKPTVIEDGESIPQMPTLSYQAPVTDRAALTQGWTQLLASADDVGHLMGEEENISAALLAEVETTEQNGTTYYVMGGDDGGDLVPTAALNDARLTLSTSAEAARNLEATAGAAKADAETAGVSFRINVAPIARTVRAMAPVFGDAEYDEENDTVTEKPSEELIEAADALDAVAGKLESISGSITTPGDRVHTEIHFHLK